MLKVATDAEDQSDGWLRKGEIELPTYHAVQITRFSLRLQWFARFFLVAARRLCYSVGTESKELFITTHLMTTTALSWTVPT